MSPLIKRKSKITLDLLIAIIVAIGILTFIAVTLVRAPRVKATDDEQTCWFDHDFEKKDLFDNMLD